MIELLIRHLAQTGRQLAAAVRDRRTGDEGGLNTLEIVVLSLGVLGLATLLVAALREAVTSRTDQLR